jgi:hsp70-interacting protein
LFTLAKIHEFNIFDSKISATKNEDPTKPSEFHEMDPERKRFLEEALKSLTIDVVEQLQKAMEVLISGNASEEDQVNSLEVVTSFVADIDTANGNSLIFTIS